jgi:conjugative transfer signal peptidase TraF
MVFETSAMFAPRTFQSERNHFELFSLGSIAQGLAMSSPPPTVTVMIAALALIAFTMRPKPTPLLVWNASASVPIGLYSVRSINKLIVTDLVIAMPPEPLATFLAEDGYLPLSVLLIKRVLALPGQHVCRHELLISVDGIDMGLARQRDRRGRSLPVWQGCQVIAAGEVFLMNWEEPASLDGRYFGPIHSSAIVGRAEPLWTFQ